VATRIQLRRDTEANWTSANPTLSSGELAYSTDVNKIKIGNGSSSWSSLSYITDTTDKITEGISNLFYTDERVDDRVSQLLTAGSNISLSYNDEAGTLTISATEDDLSNNTTNDLAEGTNNLYFTVERAQDAVGEMVTGNTESGISVTYDDEAGKLNFNVNDPTLTFTGDATGSGTITDLGSTSIELTVTDNSHNHTSSNVSDFVESTQDVVGGMVEANIESGISVTYDDETGKLNFNVNDPTITLSGDVTGSATMTDLGNVTITTTVAADSVALGTDTTGDYVATIAGTENQITVSGAGTEGRAATLAVSSSFVFPGTVTLNSSPTQSLHAATKQYVDELAEGLKTKPAVEIATTSNLSATYNNGTNGVGATLTANSNGAFPEVDGITLSSVVPGQNGVLVKNQSNPEQNGRYNLTQVGDSENPWILTRCGLCDESSEIPGIYTFVKTGTLYAGTGWVQIVSNPSTFVIGTDAILVTQFSGAGTYTAGTGISLNGTQFSNTGVLSLAGTANEIEVSASTGNVVISLPSIINADTTGNAATVTNGVVTTGSYSDPSWLSISKSFVGLGNVENTALSTWAGSSNISTLGTISSGVWQGTSISTTYTDAKVTSVNGSTGAITNVALTSGKLSQFAATTSAELAGVISDETGSGALVFSNSPTFIGTVVLPSTTSIGDVSSTEIGYLDGVTSSIQTQLDSKSNLIISSNVQTGTSYTLVLSDSGKLIETNNAGSNSINVPLDSSVAFSIGTKIDILQTGAGQTTISPVSGVTINSKEGSLKLTGQWSAATLIKRGTNTWALIGDLSA
jgi:hypothetical protein